MSDQRLRELERHALAGDEAVLSAWSDELKRLGLAFVECDACWGKGWVGPQAKPKRCAYCAEGKPKIREESVYTLRDNTGTVPLAPPPGRPRRRVETNEGHWGQRAREVISRVMTENPTVDGKELRALLRPAYPFGPRKYHPYKIWCRLVKEAVDARS